MNKTIKTISAEDLYFTPIPRRENEMIVEDMIPQGLTILAGPPKSCKSWFVLDLAIAAARGAPILGKNTIGCGVLYFALEDREARLQKRLHALEVDDPPGNLYLATSCPSLGSEMLTSLNEILKEHPDIRLIIIDTLQKIRKTDTGTSSTNQYGRDTDELSMLKDFADKRNLAILIVHHVTKRIDPNDPANDVRGSSGMTATPDAILILRKERVQKNGELLNISRDLPQWKMNMVFEGFRWQLKELITEEEMGKEAVPEILYRIAEMIKGRGRWEGTMSQLLEEVGEIEMPSNVLSRKIAQFGSSVFDSEHIEIQQKRSSKERRYTLIYHPETEDETVTDDSWYMHEESSSPSLSSPVNEAERLAFVERAKRTLLQAFN